MARYDFAKLRKEHGIQQKELADAAGVSQGFMSSIENGRNLFPEERWQLLYERFPDINFEAYKIIEKEQGSTNSNNDNSPITINDPEVIKAFLAFVKKEVGENHPQSTPEEMTQLRKDYLKLVSDFNEQRSAIDEYQKKIYDLQNQIVELKMLLLKNGISFDESK